LEDRTLVWPDLLLRNFRYAARTLRRSPGFAAAIVLTLALGIGANTAIFSIVDRVLFRNLPYADSEQLVMVYETRPGRAGLNAVSTANWLDWQKESRSFESLAAWGSGEFSWQMNLTGQGDAERLNGQFVSEGFFPLLRAKPELGSVLGVENYRPGASLAIVLSHSLWQRR
jgi:putative ABC transport system permease protein